jgi:hypothetical protein
MMLYIIIGAAGFVLVVVIVLLVIRFRPRYEIVLLSEEEEVPELINEMATTNLTQFQTALEHVFDNPFYNEGAPPADERSDHAFSDPDEAGLLPA